MQADELPPEAPDLPTGIERAREHARKKREEAGLPPLAPDELEQPRPKKGRSAGAKRSKKHGQFMGRAEEAPGTS